MAKSVNERSTGGHINSFSGKYKQKYCKSCGKGDCSSSPGVTLNPIFSTQKFSDVRGVSLTTVCKILNHKREK